MACCHYRLAATGLLSVAFAIGCSGGGTDSGTGGGAGSGSKAAGSFAAATPPSDVCSLLTLSDVQGLFPGAASGSEQKSPDTNDLGFWSRDCKWVGTPSSVSVELVVFGALTKDGLAGVKLAAKTGTMTMPVSGLGDEAHYWEESGSGTNGLWALRGSYSVDVTAYFFKPFPAETLFHPLVAKALGQLK